MTITTLPTRVSYATDGVSTTFTIPFPFFGAAEINAGLVNPTTGAITFLYLNGDYTVTGGNDATGALVFATAPAAGQTLLIYRLTNRTQLTDLQANDDMPAAALEMAFDRLVALAQEDLETLGRTLHAPVQDSALVPLPTASIRANNLLGFDANGAPVVVTPYPAGTTQIIYTPQPPEAPIVASQVNAGSGSFWTNYDPPGIINRLNDRLFMGDAVNSVGNVDESSPTWVDTVWGFPITQNSRLACIDGFSLQAITAATKSTTDRPLDEQVPIAGSFYGYNAAPAAAPGTGQVWAIYCEGRRAEYANTTFGDETDCCNLGSFVQATPFNPVPLGSTIGKWIAAGGQVDTSNDCTAAIGIANNGAKWGIGIVFQSNAITGTDGLSGTGNAIAFANHHFMSWYNASGQITGNIIGYCANASNMMSLQFTDAGVTVTGPAGYPSLIVAPLNNGSNGVQISGGVSGSAATIYADGTDTAVPLIISTKGGADLRVAERIIPLTDNAFAFGDPTNRWSSIWSANGAIQTSDPTLKTDIATLPDMIGLVSALDPKTFRWKSGGLDVTHHANGTKTVAARPGKRTHWGFMAPDVKAAFAATGLDFGGYVKGEDGTEALRPDQLIPPLWKCVQELIAKVAALEAAKP